MNQTLIYLKLKEFFVSESQLYNFSFSSKNFMKSTISNPLIFLLYLYYINLINYFVSVNILGESK